MHAIHTSTVPGRRHECYFKPWKQRLAGAFALPRVMQLAHLSDSSLQVPLSFPYTPSLHPGLCSSATPQAQLLEIDCSVSNSSPSLSVPSPSLSLCGALITPGYCIHLHLSRCCDHLCEVRDLDCFAHCSVFLMQGGHLINICGRKGGREEKKERGRVGGREVVFLSTLKLKYLCLARLPEMRGNNPTYI